MNVESIKADTQQVVDRVRGGDTDSGGSSAMGGDNVAEFIIRSAERYGLAMHGLDACEITPAGFGKQAFGFPVSWWAGHIQIASLAGAFGQPQRRAAQIRASILSQVLRNAFSNLPRTVRICQRVGEVYVQFNTAEALRRLAGGTLRNLTSQGGAQGWRNPPAAPHLSAAAAKFVLASYGAATIGVAKGVRRLEDVIGMALTGSDRITACFPIANVPLDRNDAAAGQADAVQEELALLAMVYHVNANDYRNFVG
jgi:hypothetical protein